MNRIITTLLFAVCSAGPGLLPAGAGLALADGAPSLITVNLNPDAWPIEPFTLLDHQGQRFTEARLEGRWTFVVFGDTRCAERCGAMTALAGVRERMGKARAGDDTQVLFISVARERDERLRDFVTAFNETFIGASGSPETLAQLSTLLNARVSLDQTQVSEPAPIMLVDPDGFPKAQFFPPYDVGALTSEYLRIRLCRGQSR